MLLMSWELSLLSGKLKSNPSAELVYSVVITFILIQIWDNVTSDWLKERASENDVCWEKGFILFAPGCDT